MGINSQHLCNYVIKPTLDRLGLGSLSAEMLLLATCAHESLCGHFLKQYPQGPALGIFQIEPATHADVWEHFLNYNDELKQKVLSFLPRDCSLAQAESELITNLGYACAIARLIYYRVPEALPDANDIQGLAHYWKTYYNTHQGKGRVEDFVDSYQHFVD